MLRNFRYMAKNAFMRPPIAGQFSTMDNNGTRSFGAMLGLSFLGFAGGVGGVGTLILLYAKIEQIKADTQLKELLYETLAQEINKEKIESSEPQTRHGI